MSQFGFLLPEWPDFYEAAARAESLALTDPRACAFYARRALELAVTWLYKFDVRLKLPYQESLSALIHEPSFKNTVGQAIFFKANFLKDVGNRAVHTTKATSEGEARAAVKELFHVSFWLARTYSKGARPADSLAFDAAKLPKPIAQIAKLTLEQLRKREAELKEKDEKLAETLARHAALDAELQQLRAEVEAARAKNAAVPDTHDYAEAETRDRFIDLLLREAGWDLDAPNVAEYPVTGMPNATGKGYVDYVLWGDDGLPLAVVEAKATRHSALKGQEQAKLYADCLERSTGQRPLIFGTNGYEHFLWDDTAYPPRAVQGFYKKDELALLVQRRTTRKRLADTDVSKTIVERYYQHRAIRRLAETFEIHRQRRALLVMATGAGKTRTVIALADLLMRANWAKRTLFLADRKALVSQAARAFVAHLPSATTVNLLEDKTTEGRIYVSTYPTMMTLIDDMQAGKRRFGPGHFDLVVIDEAHRSVYRKYGAIFEYFDSMLVGLTATPREEIDRNTYRLFNLEDGVPTDSYSLQEAVNDRFLVPMKAFSVPTRFLREGIRYDALSQEEKETWEELEWDEDGVMPDRVEAEALNRWLFNADTVDQVIAHLMTNGQHVAGGDRLAKTIIFAKGHKHAEFIVQRFDLAYPNLAGSFARVIDNQVDYAQSLIDSFSKPASAPHIAVSVDMLDTGIDIPEIANLVFFKMVRSPTKFWQMVGRGTRLCKDLFGPGQDKQYFSVFDFCQNLEFFSQPAGAAEAATPDSLAARLFHTRLDLIAALDENLVDSGAADGALRQQLAERLRGEVAAMNIHNFVVRPHRKLVEDFAAAEAWAHLSRENREKLAGSVAGLPSALPSEPEEAKRFDLLMLRLQLGTIIPVPGFAAQQEAVMAIASALEEQTSIPAIAAQLPLIQDIQSEAWWQDVTRAMLEQARRALRLLVPLIEKRRRQPIYTDFMDTLGVADEVTFERLTPAGDFEKFRAKMRHFLQAHESHVAINKLRMNRPLTETDIAELERMLIEEGGSTPEDLGRARAQCQNLGLFVRSLVGLDRGAAKDAFSEFLVGRTLRPNQIAFLDMLINHLTEHGSVEPERLYESPYTDMNSASVEGLFSPAESDRVFTILNDVKARAAA